MSEREDSTDHIDWDTMAEERLGQRPRRVNTPEGLALLPDALARIRLLEAQLETARAAAEVADEGTEILVGLIESIERKGHYSVEATACFLNQAANCFREIRGLFEVPRDAVGSSRDA